MDDGTSSGDTQNRKEKLPVTFLSYQAEQPISRIQDMTDYENLTDLSGLPVSAGISMSRDNSDRLSSHGFTIVLDTHVSKTAQESPILDSTDLASQQHAIKLSFQMLEHDDNTQKEEGDISQTAESPKDSHAELSTDSIDANEQYLQENQGEVTTIIDGKSLFNQQNVESITKDTQEHQAKTTQNDTNTNEPDVEPTKTVGSKYLKSNTTRKKDKKKKGSLKNQTDKQVGKVEMPKSEHITAVSCLHHTTASTRALETDTALSGSRDTTEPEEVLIFNIKQKEVICARDDLEPQENTDKQPRPTSTNIKSSSHSCPSGSPPPDVKSADSKHITENKVFESVAENISEICTVVTESVITTTLPSELEFSIHAEATSHNQMEDSDSTSYVQPEGAKTDVYGHEGGRSEGLNDEREESKREENQSASAMDTLLHIITNVQPVMDISSISSEIRAKGETWFLEPSLTNTEKQLQRIVLSVLRCRYQPVQLNTELMRQQLQEAECCRQRVVELVAVQTKCEGSSLSQSSRSMEGRFNAALLDAIATVQVKEAQLQQITQYHQQIETLQDVLQKLEGELDMLNLVTLKSSAIQTEKLHAFLKDMVQKKSMLKKLVDTCNQVSAHLGEAEGPVACLMQVKNLQEKWQILEDAADQTLRSANICMKEASTLMKDAKALLNKVESLNTASPSSSPQSQVDSQSIIHEVLRSSDFAEVNERHQYLLELSHSLFQCPLGEKEREEVEHVLQNLKSQMKCTEEKLGTCKACTSDHSLTEITETMKACYIWAKHTGCQITKRKKLSLFPDEANHQVNVMNKLQSEIFSKQAVVKKLREDVTRLNRTDHALILSALDALEGFYSKIAKDADDASVELIEMLHIRQRLETQISDHSTWLALLLEKESSKDTAIELGTTIKDLKVHYQRHKATLKEAERRVAIIQTLLNETKNVIPGLSMEDTFHLIDKLASLRVETSRVVISEQISCWELELLLHAQKSSTEECISIQKSLRQIAADLERQRYPLTKESLSAFDPVRHMLTDHLSQALEVQHYPEHQRKDLLQTILTLWERTQLLDQQAKEHEEYLLSMQLLDNCIEEVKKKVPQVSDGRKEADKRLGLGQALLVEMPLVKISYQQTADRLETISGDLYPSQLNSERQKIQNMIQSLAGWEHIISTDVKDLECSLLISSLSKSIELTPLAEHFAKAKEQLKGCKYIYPDDKAVNTALQKCSTLKMTVASGLRVLEICKDCTDVESYRNNTDVGSRILKECEMHTDKLLQAKEALKEYQMAVQRAVGFLQQMDAKLLIPSASFKDYREDLHHTRQIIASLTKGFQAHMSEIQARLPRACFSIPHTEKLHIQVVSHLFVWDAMLEAQSQLRLEALQRCIMDLSTHSNHHDEITQLLWHFDSMLSLSTSHKPSSLEECQDQLEKVKVLQGELDNTSKKLEELRASCPVLHCNVPADQTIESLQRHWVMLQRKLEALKSNLTHAETRWMEITLRMTKSRETLRQLQHDLTEVSKVKGSLENLKGVLMQTEEIQNSLDQEHLTLASLQHCKSQLPSVSTHEKLSSPTQMTQDLQSLQSHCISLREESSEVRRDVLSEIQQWGRFKEELNSVWQSVSSLLSVLETQSDPTHIRGVRVELESQNVKLQEIMSRMRIKSSDTPQEVQILLQQVTLSLKEVKEKVGQCMERMGSLHKMTEHVDKVTVGLNYIQALLQQQRPTLPEAENVLKRVWDELDQWHSRITELEVEVQELAEEQPERAHILMDELTKPLQLYQAVAKQAEQRTAFMSRIPAYLQEHEDVLRGSKCWLAETQSWLDTPQVYTTAKCLHSHANYLQIILDEMKGMQDSLDALWPTLQEISAVCDTSDQEQNLSQISTRINKVQRCALEPLGLLQHAAAEMDAIESEVKTMERNVAKIRSILSTINTQDIPPEEHLQNRQVILENLQVMERTLAEIERCRHSLGLPAGAEISLSAFHRAEQLQPQIHELQQLTEEQNAALKVAIGHPVELISPSGGLTMSNLALHSLGDVTVSLKTPYSMEEDDDQSDETLTNSDSEQELDMAHVEEKHPKTRASTTDQESEIKGSFPKEIKRPIESVPSNTETKPENTSTMLPQRTAVVTSYSSSGIKYAGPFPATTEPKTIPPVTKQENQESGKTPVEEEHAEARTTTMVKVSVTKESPKDIKHPMKPVPLRTENKSENAAMPTQLEQSISAPTNANSNSEDACPVPATTAQHFETITTVIKPVNQVSAMTPVNEEHSETRAATTVQESVTKDSSLKETKRAVESEQIETKPETADSQVKGTVLHATACSAFVGPVPESPVEIVTPVTLIPAVQISIPTKLCVNKAQKVIKDIRHIETMKKPEDATHKDVLKSTEKSTLRPVLVAKDRDRVSIRTDSSDQQEESTSKPLKNEEMKHTTISKDHQAGCPIYKAVNTTKPALLLSHPGTDTVPQKDKAWDETPVDEKHVETGSSMVTQLSGTEESPSEDIERQTKSVPLKPEIKPEDFTPPTQIKRPISDTTDGSSFAEDPVPAMTAQHLETLVPVTVLPDPAEQFDVQTTISVREPEEKLPDIRHVERMEKHESMKPAKGTQQLKEIQTSALKPGMVAEDKAVINIKTEPALQTLTGQLDESTAKPLFLLAKEAERSTAIVQEIENKLPTLLISHHDTVPEQQAAEELQSEMKEQRNLIMAIAHHSSSSDLEQEEQTQCQTHEGSSGASLGVPHRLLLKEVTWTQLLPRLRVLLDSLNTKSEVRALTEHEVMGDVGAVTQEMHGHVERLRHIHQKALSSGTSVGVTQPEMCEALSSLSHTFSRIMHTLHVPSELSRESIQLQLLNLQCLSSQMTSLSKVISSMSSEDVVAFGSEIPDASSCLEQIQSCIFSIQTALSSQEELLNRQLGHTAQHQAGKQLLESPVSILEARGAQQSDLTTLIQDLSHLLGVQGSVWRSKREQKEREKEGSVLHCSHQTLVQGLRNMLELSAESLQNTQVTHPPSCSQLQRLLTGHKKFFQELKRYHVMVLHLSKLLPEGALQGQADIQNMVSELVLQAQDQGVQMQHKVKECSKYEEIRMNLRKQLDDLEAAMPRNDLDSEPVPQLQDRLQVYQRLQKLLEDIRPQLELLQAHGHTDPRSELQAHWLALKRQLEKGLQCTTEILINYTRFQSCSVQLDMWMGAERANVQMWNSLSDSQPKDPKLLLPKLMDFIKELESRSVQKTDLVKAGTRVLQLSDSELPALRQHLAQIEQDWSELSNSRPFVQHLLQQLLSGLDQTEVRAELSPWLEDMKARLEEERSREHHVSNSSELAMLEQRLKDCKVEITSRQLCLNFLNQIAEETCVAEDATNRNECLIFCEQLGALNHQWIDLQRKVDCQMWETEHKKQGCIEREGRLQKLCSWISEQEEKIKVNERPAWSTQIQQTLKDFEEVDDKLKLKSAELQQLRSLHLLGLHDGQHPGDQTFSSQVEATSQQCQALSQKICAVRAALIMLNKQWAQFETEFRAASLQTVNMAYQLECSRIPRLSLSQNKEHVEQLQALQEKVKRSEETWNNLSRLFLDLNGKIHPGASLLLSNQLDHERAQWTSMIRDVETELQKAQTELALWQEYSLLYEDCSEDLSHLWEQWETLLKAPEEIEDRIQLVQSRKDIISELEAKLENLQGSVGNVFEASKHLVAQIESHAAPIIQSETRLLSRDLVHLGQALTTTRVQLQDELEEQASVKTALDSLVGCFNRVENVMTSPTAPIECLKLALLELSALTPDLRALNERGLILPLTTCETEQLQDLNKRWMLIFSQAMDRHRAMYSEQLGALNFQQKCQAWMDLLDVVQSSLSSNKSINGSSISERLAAHQKLKVEVLIGQQLLDGVIAEALRLLQKGQIENRSDLILKLTQLKDHWHDTLYRVRQCSIHLECLTGQWMLYRTGMKRIWRFVNGLRPLLSPAVLAPCSIQQLQQSIQDYEKIQKLLSYHEQLYTQTVQACRHIFPLADDQAQKELTSDLEGLQEAWMQSYSLFEQRKGLTESVIQNWKSCEAELADSAVKLKEIANRMKNLPPENLELQEKLLKGEEEALELWAGGLKELVTMKADVSQYVLPTDMALLQAQVEALHSQWEELCMKVSKRKQEITDHLNAWIIFNDKHKELCKWLAQMEKKVSHSNEYLSIEEMVEKLKKDCMEEINLFSENKSHLKQLGQQMLLASDRAKEAKIEGMLRDVNDRWQHLFDHIETRVNKLRQTLVAVQQLDKNMSNLRSWLSRIEAELTKPMNYSVCDRDEIQKRLDEQQELQRDIEQHTEGVTSVLTLCDGLLHEEDACIGDVKNDSIQLTARSLDQRWRNICSLSLERKIRIEETWQLWYKFQEDLSHFEDWLNLAEQTAAEPKSSDVLYTVAREELMRYEGFQKEVNEKLIQLDKINNQYCRLARENRTDAATRLRTLVHRANKRWDALHKRVAAILRRLKHFTTQREEFEGRWKSLHAWLTDMDLQLTNMENFSETSIHHKLKKLKGLKKEITRNTNKIDSLIVFGEGLIQKSAPHDAVLIEDELEELHSYCQQVFNRVGCLHQHLTSSPLVDSKPEKSEICISDSNTVMEGSAVAELSLDTSSSQASVSLLEPPQEQSGRDTPLSIDSIPLEWDHTGDVGSSSSHEDEEDDATFFSVLSGVKVTESAEAFVSSTVESLTSGEAQNWHSQSATEKNHFNLDPPDTESATPARASTPHKQGYVQLMSECSSSIKGVKKVSLILDDDEHQDDQGLISLTAADNQSGVIERWELLQAQAVNEEQRHSRDRKQLTSDLHKITNWLDQVIPELETLQKAETASVSVQIMEKRVKQLKDMQKAFGCYKTLMLSLNLGGRELQLEASPEVKRLKEDLFNMNKSWTEACESLEGWENSLRQSLMRCQEFHETLHSLLLWLAHAESRQFAVNIHDSSVQPSTLQEHRTALLGLEEELKIRQTRVSSLQEITSELLPECGLEEGSEATEKLHVIHNKLQLLMRQVKQDLQTIQERLESSGAAAAAAAASTGQDPGSSSTELKVEPSADSRSEASPREENRGSPPQRSFFYRVLRAAFPLHILFLLLLVLACLVPMSAEDYSCTLSNNFARSFYPMLRYTNGPPPT